MKIHFIGICGVGMSGLAIAMHQNGWQVSGSDKGFYPPVSTHLNEAGVSYYPGWHPDKMIDGGIPDLIVVGNVAGSENPEWIYAQTNKIECVSYPELIARHFIKQNSIVVAGTFGKTTSTALLAWVFKSNNINLSYMFGGVANFAAAALVDSNWSIIEGDEYKTGRGDSRPKFTHYSPTHLLLTAAIWDHADVYPTEELYGAAFVKLITSIPASGKIVINKKNTEIINDQLPMVKCQIITYGDSLDDDYRYHSIIQTKNGLTFKISHAGEEYDIATQMIGEFCASNITGVFAMAELAQIPPVQIISALKTFPGLKRRLEKRFSDQIDIYDDIAHSPTKAKAVLESLKKIYDGKIIAVFEPNTGNRERNSVPGYDNAFTAADILFIPQLTKVKINPNDSETPIDGEELCQTISKTHANARYIPDDDELINYIMETVKPGDAIIFLGSHGFRGMIENLIEKI